jgi:hypothetical protein
LPNAHILKLLGQKNAVMKTIPALMCFASQRRDKLNTFEKAIHLLSIAVQLIDDLSYSEPTLFDAGSCSYGEAQT